MTITGSITLIEESTAGNALKVFSAQGLEIHRHAPTIVQGVDGHRSEGSHPSNIIWFGGRATDLHGITHVRIADSKNAVIIDGELNKFFTTPHDVPGGVHFDVL